MQQSIVIIGPAHPLRGGLASYDERLAREFIRSGHQACIYTFSLQYPSFLFPGTTQYSTEPQPKDLSIEVCINSINPLNWIMVGKKLKKLNPDIIVVRYWLPFMGPCLGSILRLAKRNKHTKIICIADNIIPHEKRIMDTQFTSYFMKPIDGFICMSEKVLHDLKALSNKPSLAVKHPLYDNFGEIVSKSIAKHHLNLSTETSILLFFGFIRKYKGLDILFDAIHLLKKSGYLNQHQIKFLIAGEFYENENVYLEQIAKLQIEDNIILKKEFITDSEVKYYLCAADGVVQPYRNATQSGVTPLAYHFEIPMIVTNVGGLPDMVPPSVGLVAESNAESLANAIQQFYSLDASKMKLSLKEEKKKYSWQNITSAILSLASKP